MRRQRFRRATPEERATRDAAREAYVAAFLGGDGPAQVAALTVLHEVLGQMRIGSDSAARPGVDHREPAYVDLVHPRETAPRVGVV